MSGDTKDALSPTPGNISRMTWFQAFRGDFGYSNYGEYRTSVTWDIPFAAIIYTCILISLAAIIAAAGIRGKERWYTLIRVIYSLVVGSIILVSIFGYCWQQGEVGVHSPYIYRSTGYVNGAIGVRVGLKTVNLTLKGEFSGGESRFSYNEEIQLENVLHDPPETWKALEQGLPQSLLSIIEYFDVDEGGLRFGRAVFMAGYFANILLWTAFSFWVTANILLCSVVWYGAACFSLTGVCMVLSAGVYHLLCPQDTIRMPCSDGVLRLTYGWCFWSSLVFGILTILSGLILFALEHTVPKKLAEFFLLDTALEDQEEHKQLQSPTFINTPDTVARAMGMKKMPPRSRSPVNWYVNYGCDAKKSSSGNPVYSEQIPESESSFVKSESGDSYRPRAFSNISEEDDVFDHSDKTKEASAGVDPDKELDRLSEIYIDVESRRSSGSSLMCTKQRPYMKEFDAMNSR